MASDPPARRVAVVVPVHGSSADLDRLLDRLDAQDWDRDRLLVIVAVDGPDPELEAVARARADEVVVLPENQGSYAARNRALARLPDDVDVVCFTDADCLPAPGWVRAHVAALADADLSGGAILVTTRPDPSPAEHVDRLRHLKQKQYVTVEGYAATANLAVRRAVVDAQQFDAGLRSSGDADFCRRARERGFSLRYTPTATVEHPARTTAEEVRRKVRRIAAGIRTTPASWIGRDAPPRHLLDLGVARAAWSERVSRDPFWLLRAVVLDRWAAEQVRRAVLETKRGEAS